MVAARKRITSLPISMALMVASASMASRVLLLSSPLPTLTVTLLRSSNPTPVYVASVVLHVPYTALSLTSATLVNDTSSTLA
jgi:hypothetical protein